MALTRYTPSFRFHSCGVVGHAPAVEAPIAGTFNGPSGMIAIYAQPGSNPAKNLFPRLPTRKAKKFTPYFFSGSAFANQTQEAHR
jgi:hypothetical protein